MTEQYIRQLCRDCFILQHTSSHTQHRIMLTMFDMSLRMYIIGWEDVSALGDDKKRRIDVDTFNLL